MSDRSGHEVYRKEGQRYTAPGPTDKWPPPQRTRSSGLEMFLNFFSKGYPMECSLTMIGFVKFG